MFVEVSRLSKSYRRGRTVLDEIDFTALPASVTAVIGPNGAGKSTMFKLMTNIVRGRGQTRYGGRRWCDLDIPRQVVGAHVGEPFHSYRRVIDHLGLVAEVAGASSTQLDEVIERLKLGAVLQKRISTLSLGTRQRVGLASALLGDPQVLILDEPCNCLDPKEAEALHLWLAELAQGGRTVIIATHQLQRLESYATDVVVLVNGRLCASGPIATVVENLDTDPHVADRLGRIYRSYAW